MRQFSSIGLRMLAYVLAGVILCATTSDAQQSPGAVPGANLTVGQTSQTPATVATHTSAPKPSVMNGIRASDYPGFQDMWKLVTVRYRVDTGEERFTYANPLAYETLQKGGTDYPDGAVFAKIGVMTQEDPDFTSSKVPSGAKRMQFMVRNKALYASTDGWGYALFGPDGHRLSITDEKTDATACAVCHEVVQKRGYVFSQLMNLASAAPSEPFPHDTRIPPNVSFTDIDMSGLEPRLQRYLPLATTRIRFLDGSLHDHPFVGTMDEIMPSLIQETIRAGVPVVFTYNNPPIFSLARKADASEIEQNKVKCAPGKQLYVTLYSPSPSRPPVRHTLCDRAQ